jgi:hypothetical protein
MTNKTIDSWDDFTGSNFLKSIQVKNEQDAFVVIKVEIFEDDDKSAKPRLILENNQISYIFDLNVTNSNFCKDSGITSPKLLVGKKIFFKKVLVNSPVTKKEVESLRILKIE